MEITREEKIKIVLDRISKSVYSNQGGGVSGGPGVVSAYVGSHKEVDLNKLAEVLLDLIEGQPVFVNGKGGADPKNS